MTEKESTAVTERPATAMYEPENAEQVGGMIALAIEQKVPVEVLERLVALQERISERNARAAFFDALAQFRAKCPPIQKTRENSQFSVTRNGVKRPSKYAPLEEIDRVAGPVAAECGLTWTWDTAVEGEMMYVTCRLLHVLGHSEKATVTMPHGSNAGSSPQQKYGSTQTYGMRYSLIAALGLTTADEDVDGQGAAEPAVTLSPEQEATINALIREVEADGPKFLDYMGAKSVGDILADDYTKAVRLLERKRA